ncbi:lipid droplet-associated protein [Gandjariella thermophila]|uniref:Lipid droplet-associated protein n=1 Tax=Gandjariella thermophila TaxID=1931992 RepID=A0A4D4J5S0_9PSEU|nr:lipid droplet-associated protein [Gandjariella thermophila]GDY29939.1 hypothetical protein GTS_15720 [Gandjariella thermophila]
MKCLPLPVRVAAGLAVTAVDEARRLPQQLAGLPVTLVSQALQLSMRVQQTVTELAIKGDDLLAGLRPAPETPEWATFDEDLPEPGAGGPDVADPWAQEERALAEEHVEGEFDSGAEGTDGEGPDALPEYGELSLPQLRGRLRRLSAVQLEELLAYEREHAARPEFLGMLERRLLTVRNQQR